MNQQERDALREMHADASFWDDPGCSCCESTLFEGCAAGCSEWPCDVIKVLDAWEAEVHDGSEVSTTREVCDHADWTSNAYWTNNVYSDGVYVDMGYRYCPKCGEKL